MKINQGVLEEVYPNDLEQYYTSDGNITSFISNSLQALWSISLTPSGIRSIE